MILMALDQTREFLGVTSVSPTNLVQTTIPLFLHTLDNAFLRSSLLPADRDGCLSLAAKKIEARVIRFLFTRGLWLIFLEWTLFRCLAVQFNFDYCLTLLNVLWTLGWAMIVLSVLVHLPLPVTTALGVVLIAGHNLLDPDSNLESALVDPAPSRFYPDNGNAFGFRCLSPHSMGWGNGRWLQPRKDLHLASQSPRL